MQFSENLNIDLSSSKRPEMPVQVEWEIKVPEPAGGLKKFLFGKFGKLDKVVRLSIEDVKLDPCLKYTGNLKDLVFLRSQGNSGSSLEFNLTDLKTYCRVMVDPNRITDCTEREKAYADRKPYPLTFKVVLADKSKKIEDHDVKVNINLTPVHLDPSVRLSLEEDFTYSSAKDFVEIGSIMVANPTPDLEFTPAIDLSLKLDIINSSVPLPADAIHVGSTDGTNSYVIENLIPHDPRCKKMHNGKEEIVLPIFIDMRRLSNPLVPKETLQAVCNWSYHHSYNAAEYLAGDRVIEEIEFLQDAQGAELIVNLLDSEGNPVQRITNGQSITLPEIGFFAEGNTVTDHSFRLANLATDTSRAGAGVRVSNLTISETIEGAILKDRADNYINELFGKSDESVAELSVSSGYMLRNGADSHTDFTVTFDPAKVLNAVQTRDFHFFSILTIEFDYVENSTGKPFDSFTPQHFRFDVRQPLFLKPNPRWLCIDYGSSAIVCKYDDTILNLHTRKSAILKKALSKNAKALLKDNLESGTEFLSSDIVLHTPADPEANTDVSSLCSEQTVRNDQCYDKLAVFLSPTSAMIVNEVLRQLPCLKLLVGNELLPPNPHYQTFEYEITNPNGGLVKVKAEAVRESNPEKSLVVIDNVFRESYEALLRYFVIPEVQNINLINRLVLTYPNTYTPRHLDTLRGIVKKAIPAVRELEFVSESDAVAAYYLENWTKYHEQGANPSTNENILVYDMGAGTLDLSLIRKTADSQGRITMEILAKIGTCKAGNYLDFVLAEIVSDLMGETSKGGMALASTQVAASADIGKERSRLKDFVKNTLKPQLGEKNRDMSMEFKSGNGETYKPFTIGQVLSDPRLVQFLHDVTDDIVGQLARFAGEDRPSVDTVLMSGRSSLFGPLSVYLSKAVKDFNNRSGITAFIRLDKPINGDTDISRQKVAVSEGAMAIMARNYRSENSLRRIISKRVYASFGVAYQDLGSWHYVELLNYRNIPADLKGEYNGERINLPHLNNIPSLTVVQSYLDAESTAKALNAGNWDYIAEMERITLDGQSSESLMMKINNQNNVVLYIGQHRTRGQAPMGDDLTSEAIRRSVWPVTI